MARQLWFLRHGEAEPHGTRADAQRRLTDRGVEQSQAAGTALRELGVAFDVVYTSPKVRARDTAAHASRAMGGPEPVEHDPLASGFDADEALVLLQTAGEEQRVLVVGHEPDFSLAVHDLTGARIDIKKGGVAAVRVDGGQAELVVLLRPRELRSIG